MSKLSAILISGASNTGKSTLAQTLGKQLGWNTQSTDSFARHPGRPWPQPNAFVLDYFNGLTSETIFWMLNAHYENMERLIEVKIKPMISTQVPFVLEGSALRPAQMASLQSSGIKSVCLYASNQFLHRRIMKESNFDAQQVNVKSAIEKFIDRSKRDNDQLRSEAKQHGIHLINVESTQALAKLFV